MTRPLACCAVLLAAAALAQPKEAKAKASAEALPEGAVRLEAGHEAWKDAAPPLPPSVKVTVLEGDPKAEGQFTMRVKLPRGFTLPLHTHPVDERTTVISGAVWVGFGGQPDKAKGERLGPGSFYKNPRGVPHWVMADGETVLQISTNGPWGVTKVEEKK